VSGIPHRFEDYLAQHEAQTPAWRVDEERTRCFGCMTEGVPLTRDGECRECLQYRFGYDQAEETVVLATIGGAVKAALEAGVSSKLITGAVHDAIEAERDDQADSMLRSCAKAFA